MLSTAKLKSYLEAVVELEKEVYTLKNTIAALEQEIQTPCPYSKPKPKQPYIPQKPTPKNDEKSGCLELVLIYIIFCFVMAGLYGIGGFIMTIISETNILSILGSGSLAVVCIAIIIAACIKLSKNKNKKKQYQNEAMQRYENEMETYNHNMVEYQKQMASYNIAVEQHNENQRQRIYNMRKKKNELINMLSQTQSILKDFYDLNIIPEDYRSIIPVNMFYDYICKGRTYSLERNLSANDPGAINMYEDEKYNNIIITRLNSVIANLNMIQDRQQQLYNFMEDSQRETTNLLNSIRSGVDESKSLQAESNRYAAMQTYQNQWQISQNEYRNQLLDRMYYGY